MYVKEHVPTLKKKKHVAKVICEALSIMTWWPSLWTPPSHLHRTHLCSATQLSTPGLPAWKPFFRKNPQHCLRNPLMSDKTGNRVLGENRQTYFTSKIILGRINLKYLGLCKIYLACILHNVLRLSSDSCAHSVHREPSEWPPNPPMETSAILLGSNVRKAEN